MLKTNYQKVSKVYDKNKTRTSFAKDNDLEQLLTNKQDVTIELEIANGIKEYKDVIAFLDIKFEKQP